MSYSWITYSAARSVLAGRLANSTFWTDAEMGLYLIESLRTWSALTECWNTDFAFNTSKTTTWYNLGTLKNSPRLRSVTDADLYTMMQYHLIEPVTGAATWTGTTQFSLTDLQGALQRRREQVIQASGCNLAQVSLASTPNVRSAFFPDTVLEARRARFISVDGTPATLTREDAQGFDCFEPDHLQQEAIPSSWDVVSGPPLSVELDTAPNVAGKYDFLVLQSGAIFAPPSATLLGVPDDWAWLVKWGALADLLGRESEAGDPQRAAYCLQRFTEGIEIMKASNWITRARMANVPVEITSLTAQDSYSPEWEMSGTWPAVIAAGMDFIAVCPVGSSSIDLTLVGNAPVPSADTDYVQISRDVFDVVISYAQHLAAFKQGGMEFTSTQSLTKDFYNAAKQTNKRLEQMGFFSDVTHSAGKKQDESIPRE